MRQPAVQYLLKGPFGSEEKRRDLLKRINEIEEISSPEDSITRCPNISFAAVSGESRSASFVAELRTASGSSPEPARISQTLPVDAGLRKPRGFHRIWLYFRLPKFPLLFDCYGGVNSLIP
jgi:hypothetical protein